VRVGCAAVASAARGRVESGETIFLLTTLRSFGHDGLEAVLRTLGKIDQLTVLEQSDLTPESPIVVQRRIEKPGYVPASTGLSEIDLFAVKTRFGGSLVESVRVADAQMLLSVVKRAAGLGD
jgi:hypothetical protein